MKREIWLTRFFHVVWKNISRDVLPVLVYAIFLIAVVISLIVIAYYVQIEEDWWNMTEQFFKDHAVVSSVLGTMIAIVLIFLILRPRLYIDDISTYRLQNGKDALRVQVYNTGLFEVNNVSIQLHWYRDEKGNKRKSKKMDMFRPTTPIVKGYYTGEKTNSYACHVRHHYMGWLEEYKGIRCRVTATHSLSGITRVYERFYTREEVELATKTNKDQTIMISSSKANELFSLIKKAEDISESIQSNI